MRYPSDASKITELIRTSENVLHKIRAIQFSKFVYENRIPISLGVVADELELIDENFVETDYAGVKHINVIYLILMSLKGIQDIISGIENAFEADAEMHEALQQQTPPPPNNSPVIPNFIGGVGNLGVNWDDDDDEALPAPPIETAPIIEIAPIIEPAPPVIETAPIIEPAPPVIEIAPIIEPAPPVIKTAPIIDETPPAEPPVIV